MDRDTKVQSQETTCGRPYRNLLFGILKFKTKGARTPAIESRIPKSSTIAIMMQSINNFVHQSCGNNNPVDPTTEAVPSREPKGEPSKLNLLLESNLGVYAGDLVELNQTQFRVVMPKCGEGKNGYVLLMQEVKTGKLYILKTIKHMSEAKHEVSMMKKLRDLDNVTQIVGCGVTRNYISYIIMKYCENGDLLEYIKQSSHLKESTIKCFAKQILEVLAKSHSLNIAHGDLKCENILLCNNCTTVCVADWGDAIEHNSKIRLPTIGYIAPSLLYAHRTIDMRAVDIWSFGVVVLIMAIGRYPFASKLTLNCPTMNMICKDDIEGFWAYLDSIYKVEMTNVSSELREFLSTIFVNNDSDRPTASELLMTPWLL